MTFYLFLCCHCIILVAGIVCFSIYRWLEDSYVSKKEKRDGLTDKEEVASVKELEGDRRLIDVLVDGDRPKTILGHVTQGGANNNHARNILPFLSPWWVKRLEELSCTSCYVNKSGHNVDIDRANVHIGTGFVLFWVIEMGTRKYYLHNHGRSLTKKLAESSN